MSLDQPRQRLPRLFDDDQMYSAAEVRDKLGGRTHIVTIFTWAKTGVLPRLHKISPGTSRFLGAELNAHLLKD